MNKLKKIISRIFRFFILKLDGINTGLYMELYNQWLLSEGISFKGDAKYIHHTVSFDGIDYSRIHLGSNIVISKDVTILIHDFAIEAGLTAIGCSNESRKEAYYLKDVKIGNDCFIGAKSIILCGAEIGNHCIIGAGTIISEKKYPDYSIIVGNPGKIIGDVRDWARLKYNAKEYYEGYIN